MIDSSSPTECLPRSALLRLTNRAINRRWEMFKRITCLLGLYSIAAVAATSAAEVTIEDFSKDAMSLDWRIVNDSVMGGVSTSGLDRVSDDVMRFSGQLSLENNGGFASTRGHGRFPELAGVTGFMIRVKGDGRTYQLRLRNSNGWRAPDYSASFVTKPGQWQTHVLPLKTFVAGWRGRKVPDAPALEPARISSIGILLGDKKAGLFSLEIDWIKADKR